MPIKLKYLDEIYTLLVLLFSLLAWIISTYGIVIMCIGLFISLFLKKFKYVIPWLLNFVFTINIDLALNVYINPILYISSVIVIIGMIIFLIIKKPNLKLGLSKSTYILMSIVTIIPIFWTNAQEQSHIFLYFSWFLYSLIYFFTLYSNDEDNNQMLSTSMINLGLLIALQVIIVSFNNNGFDIDKILSSSLRVGWGIFNECGIMMLSVIPYIFYSLHKKKFYFFNLLKLLIIIIACFFTNSRGTYIFGIIMLISLIILLAILTKKTKGFYLSLISITLCSVFVGLIFHMKIIELVNKVLENVFYNGLSNNGRFALYEYGIKNIFKNPYYLIFGPGFVESYYIDLGSNYIGMKNIFLVYHSTIIQTLSIGGIIGLLVFIVFIYKRYKLFFNNIKDDLYKFIVIGLIPLEMYGLIDNTYHMFYFMIPLAISMGIFESKNQGDDILC
jgi:hypothetical protein